MFVNVQFQFCQGLQFALSQASQAVAGVCSTCTWLCSWMRTIKVSNIGVFSDSARDTGTQATGNGRGRWFVKLWFIAPNPNSGFTVSSLESGNVCVLGPHAGVQTCSFLRSDFLCGPLPPPFSSVNEGWRWLVCQIRRESRDGERG